VDKVLSVAWRYDGSALCNLRDGHSARRTVVLGPNYRARSGKTSTAARGHIFSNKSDPNQRHVRAHLPYVGDNIQSLLKMMIFLMIEIYDIVRTISSRFASSIPLRMFAHCSVITASCRLYYVQSL